MATWALLLCLSWLPASAWPSRATSNVNLARTSSHVRPSLAVWSSRARSALKNVDPKIIPLLRKAEEKREKDMDLVDIDEDEQKLDDSEKSIAMQLGAKSLDLSSPVQKQYSRQVRDKLKTIKERRAEIEKAESPGWKDFERGKKLFENGHYSMALEHLTKALKIQEPLTRVGGEIQIYLAFTLDAMGRTDDACEILKIIEDTHPSVKIARQAEDIRFVFEAPKLKMEERDLNWGFTQNADRYRSRDRRMRKPIKAKYKETSKVSPILPEEDSLAVDTSIPEWLKNPTVIIIITAGVSVVAWQSAIISAAQRAAGN